MTPDNPDFLPMIRRLFADLEAHMKAEEEHDLVKLEQAVHPNRSQALATSFARTKNFVPTRSHPLAPNRPPFATAMGLLIAPLDRIADVFRRFPKE
jgi:hypothetical protein